MNEKIDKFQEMIPLYVTGQLASQQKQEFENRIEKDDHLKQELKEFQMIRESYSDLKEQIPEPSPDLFSRIMENVQPDVQKEPETQLEKLSIFDTVIEIVQQYLSAPRLAWSVAVVQTVVICFFLFSAPEETRFQTLSQNGTNIEKGIQINVVFHETAVEKNIRQVLNDLNADIISGPSENGLYVLLIKGTEDSSLVLKTLKASGLVKFSQRKY